MNKKQREAAELAKPYECPACRNPCHVVETWGRNKSMTVKLDCKCQAPRVQYAKRADLKKAKLEF